MPPEEAAFHRQEMKSRNRIAAWAATAVLVLAAGDTAAGQPSSAIQYAPGPVPQIAPPRYAYGPAQEYADGLPPQIRRSLTGAAGRQLRLVATAPQFGAPNGAPVPEAEAGPDLLAIALLAAAIAAGAGLVAFAAGRGSGPGARLRWTAIGLAVLVVGVGAGVVIATSGTGSAPTAQLPKRFFGIAPQTIVLAQDAARMKEGGIETVRVPVPWSTVQPSGPDSYDWSGLDQVVGVTAGEGLEILPVLYSTPGWVAPTYTVLPVDTVAQRSAWQTFLRAAVARYGPGGAYWDEHGPGSAAPLPEVPIDSWQVWNEANFFYFATPASPERYAKLLKISRAPIRAEDPEARIVLSGLFGSPREKPPRAMPAVNFLRRLYRVEGIKAYFDAAALHPYAADASALDSLMTDFRSVMVFNGDVSTPLWVTEMGWGSARDTAFEKGTAGQAEQLERAYTFLITNSLRLGLERVYWFSWQDDPPPAGCDFCDSVGLFRAGRPLDPKPAWFSFTRIANGGS
jgi:hypothetical protein